MATIIKTAVPNPQFLPNTSQIPNILLDKIMRDVTPAEFKIIMAIARQTYGWHKESDRISLRRLMEITGLSNRGVIGAVRNLEWLIKIHRQNGNEIPGYSLNINAETGELSSPPPELSSGDPPNSVRPPPEHSSHPSLKDTTTKDTKIKKAAGEICALTMPEWLDRELWERYRKYRGKRFSKDAECLNINKLIKLRESGNDPMAVIEQTIERGWTGLFPVKSGTRRSYVDEVCREMEEENRNAGNQRSDKAT